MGLPFTRIGFQVGFGIGPRFKAGLSIPSASRRQITASWSSFGSSGLITAMEGGREGQTLSSRLSLEISQSVRTRDRGTVEFAILATTIDYRGPFKTFQGPALSPIEGFNRFALFKSFNRGGTTRPKFRLLYWNHRRSDKGRARGCFNRFERLEYIKTWEHFPNTDAAAKTFDLKLGKFPKIVSRKRGR